MFWPLDVDVGYLLWIACVSSNRRVDVDGGRRCPGWFRSVADIAPSRESQLNVERPAHDGALDRDAYGRFGGINLYLSKR